MLWRSSSISHSDHRVPLTVIEEKRGAKPTPQSLLSKHCRCLLFQGWANDKVNKASCYPCLSLSLISYGVTIDGPGLRVKRYFRSSCSSHVRNNFRNVSVYPHFLCSGTSTWCVMTDSYREGFYHRGDPGRSGRDGSWTILSVLRCLCVRNILNIARPPQF